jgi:hypothetical protein
MRDTDRRSGTLFSYVDIEARVPATHPLRRIRELVNNGLARLNKSFGKLYSDEGRPSIPPERLLRLVLLQFVLLDPLGAPAHGAHSAIPERAAE